MPELLDKRSFIWVIDNADKIVQVNEAWLAFARENGAPELSAAMVLDQPLWRFIQGRETAYVYKQIFSRLRAGKSPINFPFRCDSPDCRRFMEMKLSLLAGAAIEFQARLLRQEFRQPQDFLGASGDRGETFLKICSWCKKIHTTGHGWAEIEEVIGPLDLFGDQAMPRMTHTICESCSDLVRRELNREVETNSD